MEAPSEAMQPLPNFACGWQGLSVTGRDQTAPDFGKDSWNWYLGVCFSWWKKKTWLIIIREEKCACLQTRGLQIAYNSPITVCHQNISAWQDQNYCHPFTFNFNLHEIMFLLLHLSLSAPNSHSSWEPPNDCFYPMGKISHYFVIPPP